MGLLVIHPGTFTTIQDEGRPGFREWGVPLGGAFDRDSAWLANALAGNQTDCAVLEMTLTGGTYEPQRPLALALAGAPMSAEIVSAAESARTLSLPIGFTLRPGERLVIGGARVGARSYLAVRGGWRTALVLGSRSQEEPIARRQVLPADDAAAPTRRPMGPFAEGLDLPFRIIDGPDAARLHDPAVWERLTFRVAPESSRMGVRLLSAPLPVRPDDDRLSAPVLPGAVQVAGQQAIVLGVACGTMGGYPVVAHVISADLGRLGQLRPGDPVRFQRIGLAEARRLGAEQSRLRRELWQRIAALVTADSGL
jgi:biotin-dependent carboxylase-like uncharacterized protein